MIYTKEKNLLSMKKYRVVRKICFVRLYIGVSVWKEEMKKCTSKDYLWLILMEASAYRKYYIYISLAWFDFTVIKLYKV